MILDEDQFRVTREPSALVVRVTDLVAAAPVLDELDELELDDLGAPVLDELELELELDELELGALAPDELVLDELELDELVLGLLLAVGLSK